MTVARRDFAKSMSTKKIFISSFLVLISVAVFNYIGIKYNLYWIYNWYDIPMHILGGLWVSLFSIYLYTYFDKDIFASDYHKKVLKIVILSLTFMTISWEIFELLGKLTFLSDGKWYWFDTIKDIIDGFIGGMIGYYFYSKQ
jgi:hypothetical protein